MTLTEFLLARIAEDEADARYLMIGLPPATGGPYAVDHPARVLAECEAKRRIVKLHPEMLEWCQGCAHEAYPCRTLAALASAYADHPDYRAEWKP